MTLPFTLKIMKKTALVGANGTGKSTMLKIIAGEISKDGGEVILAKTRRWDISHSIRI